MDDDPVARRLLAAAVRGLGSSVKEAASREEALVCCEDSGVDLVFLDLVLGRDSGLDLLSDLLASHPGLWVIMLTAHADVASAVEAMRRGARDFLAKPFPPEIVRHAVAQAIDRRLLHSRVADLESRLRSEVPGVDLASGSLAMQQALSAVGKAAASDAAVLLRGESGTGKGVLARSIHSGSRRAARPFVTVNCPTLSEELLASELFGHAKGAFTGAIRDQPGKVEAAQGGTLFLDEVSEIRPPLQAKLLRFLQDHEYERVGESRVRRADVRVVAASNRDLEAAVAAGALREDLFYRLDVVAITVPPLRQRTDDILPLARGFLTFFAAAAGRRPTAFSAEAEAAILAYPWPGNVRELRNAIERAVVFADDTVTAADLPVRVIAPAIANRESGAVPVVGANCTIDALEFAHTAAVVERARSLDEAARILGIDPSTLYRRRRRRS